MRQLFVVHGPAFGGGHAQFVRLRTPLAERGWEVSGVVPTGAPAAERLRHHGVICHEVALHRLRRTPDPRVQGALAASMRREVGALRRLIREHDVDLVQVHGDTNPHGAIAAHLEGRAVVWQIYDTVTPLPLRRLTMPLVTRLADVVTTWGRALGHAYPGAAALDDRWIPVFPPVNAREFVPGTAESRAAARHALGVPPDTVLVGSVGNLNPTKGHEHLVRAVAALRNGGIDVAARVLGAPSPAHPAYEAAVRREAAGLGLDRDAFDIVDAGPRVPQVMPGFDVLALTSVPRSEGMPTVVLEAMACGLPVVATDVGAVRELVEDGRTAVVVPSRDDETLTRVLARLLGDPGLRRRMGDAALQRFRRGFSLEALADLHERAYTRAVEHRRGRRS